MSSSQPSLPPLPCRPPSASLLIFDVLARLELSVPITVGASPDKAFDFFADHRHVSPVLEGISRWDPVSAQTQGVGAPCAVYSPALRCPLHVRLRVLRWSVPQTT